MQRTVLASGGWLFGVRFVERLTGLARIVVLARLLAPEDFGLFGIAVLAVSAVEMLAKTGFNEAIIQGRSMEAGHLGTAWSVHVLRGFVLAAFLWVVAPGVASFFEAPAVSPLLRVLALNLLLVGATNTGMVLLEKDLRFGRYAAVSAAGTFADVAISIVAAFFLRDAWALVYGAVGGNAVRLVLSYVVAAPVAPRFDPARLREFASFGRWVWGANVLHFAVNEGDDLIVARLLGPPALGVYRMAFAYAALPATEITHVVSRVTFPAYARLRDDADGLRRGYLRTVQAVALFSAPLATGIAVMAPSFVRVVLEPVWQPLVVPLQILALWGLLRSLSAITGSILLAVGKPQLITRLVAVKLAALLLLIFPLTMRYQLPGTAIAVLLSSAISFPAAALVVARLIDCPLGSYVRAWGFPVAAAGSMAMAIVAAHRYMPADFGLGGFIASIVGGATLYALLVLLVGPVLGYRALEPFFGRTAATEAVPPT